MAIEVTKRPYKKCLSGNPIHYELFSQLAADDPANVFEVRILFAPIGGAFSEVTILPFNPVAGYASFDLKDTLNSLLSYQVPAIQDDPLVVFANARQSGYFYIHYREVTAANPNPSWDEAEAQYPRFVLKAEVDYLPYRGNNFWVNYFEVKRPFLTWQYNGRLAAAGERMYLAWLNDTDVDPGNIKAVVRSYRTDETLIQEQVVDVPAAKDTVAYIPSGAAQWRLQADPAVPLYYWTVQVQDRTDPGAPVALSEVFRYELDNKYDASALTLGYRNSLGGLDSARVRGSIEKKAAYQYTEVELMTTPDYFSGNYVSPRRGVTSKKEQVTYSANLGQFRREQQDRHRDLQLTEEAWIDVRGKWWPVVILTQSFTLTKSDDTRWHMPIEYAFADGGATAYTPQSVDLGDGVFNDNVCRARLIDLSVVVNRTQVDAEVVIYATEDDPQNASTQFRYRIPELIGFTDWQLTDYGQLPLSFSIPLERQLIIELQAICMGDVVGKIVTAPIDTRAGSSGSVGTTPDAQYNAVVKNETTKDIDFTLKVDAAEAIGFVGAGSGLRVTVPADAVDARIELLLDGYSPSSVRLTPADSQQGPLMGIISGNTVVWPSVTYTGGFTIEIY